MVTSRKQSQGAYSLVEVLVAISILLLALVGPMTIAAKGLQASYYAREQAQATFLAQEGIEMIVAIRNEELLGSLNGTPSNFKHGWDWVSDQGSGKLTACFATTGCNFDASAVTSATPILNVISVMNCSTPTNCDIKLKPTSRTPYGTSGTTNTKFNRVVTLDDTDPKTPRIQSTVSWKTGVFGSGSSQSVTLNSELHFIYENII